jgi:hypothetical protein
LKSQWDSLFQALLADASRICGVKDTDRDFAYAKKRSEHEGDSFYEITLPSLGKAVTAALQTGELGDDVLRVFHARRGIPVFLQGFLRQVFRQDGTLLDYPSVDAINCLRQLTLSFAKVRKACTPDRVRAAFGRFVDIENELLSLELPELSSFRRVKTWIYGDILSEVDRKVYLSELRPYPGPGATAEKLTYNQRFNLRYWTERLEWDFPYALYGRPTWVAGFEDPPVILSPGEELPVRVVDVPKTLETPRIIAVEPAVMQQAQQSIMRELVPLLEAMPGNPLGFWDQTVNQRLARKGSVDGSVATLDLKDASDRVSNVLVHALFDGHPHLDSVVQSSRTTRANVPGHGTIPLTKFASMGSALTFPVEAMVFLIISLLGMVKAREETLSRKVINDLLREIRIYGDDIIVPTDCAPSVIEALETYGLRVNSHKSFLNGKFRESCGGDYYNGTNVTPVRFRRVVPTSRQHSLEIESWFSTMNQLDERGFFKTANAIDAILRRFVPVKGVSSFSAGMGRHSLGVAVEKWDPYLQRGLVRVPLLTSRSPIDRLDGWGALHKWFLTKNLLPGEESKAVAAVMARIDSLHREVELRDDHLSRAGRAKSANIKLSWVSAR